ncbi:MAG: hypothetical protein MZW92_04085 [Comamonadaceae bacterium]|nr:hypothetical protein [Comamonadaceae bacterium]
MREVVGRKTDGLGAVRVAPGDRRRRCASAMQEMLDRYGTGILVSAGRDPERAAARAGAGGVRRRGQGRPGPRAADQRGPGVRQRRRAEGARHGVAADAGGRGLPHARRRRRPRATRRASARSCVEYQKAPAVTRDRMYLETMQQVFAQHDARSWSTLRQRQPAAVPAVRQADAAGDAERRGRAARRAAGGAGARRRADATRSRDTSLRSRDREAR